MKEPARILHVVTHMNRGGLETMIMNYYRHIDRSLIQFDFLEHRFGEHDYSKEIIGLGGVIHQLPAVNPFSRKYLNALDAFFKAHDEYKIVHSHINCMSAIPLKYAKKNGVPVRIAHAHSTSEDKDLKYLIKCHYKTKISKYATHLFACGQNAGKWMFGEKKFNVLNNAIESEKYAYNEKTRGGIRKELDLDNKFVIGHVGRFNVPKNHVFLIDIFNELQKTNENAVLVLAGTGPLQEEIKRKVETINLKNKVMFLNLVENVDSLLQAFDVFLFPSLYEGLPLSLIEAQAAGLRCVISADVIPAEAIVTDLVETVSLKEPPGYWAEKINAYQNGYDRVNEYEQIKRAGFDVESNVGELQKIYLDGCKGAVK